MQVGLFGRSDWIHFPGSGCAVELVLYNKDAFQYGFQVPEKDIFRKGVVNVFPEGGIISCRYDAGFQFLAVG